MRKVDLLRELQEIEIALEHSRERLEAVHQQLGDRRELQEAEQAQKTLQQQLRALETEQTDLELHLSELREKLQHVDDKLYSGSVRNPKELDSLSKEAAQFRHLISSQEDRLLDSFDRVERVSTARDAARRRVAELEETWRQRQASLGRDQEQLEADITRLEAERERARSALDASSLRTYDALRRTRGGIAVVEVKQRTCQGCRISLTSSQEHQTRASQDLVLCQNCGRVLLSTT